MKRIKEIYSYREVIENFVSRDLKTRYKGSSLGFLWSFLNPLFNLIVLAAVFSFVVRAGIEHFPLFLLIAILAWQFLASSLIQGSRAIIDNGGLIKKIYLAREIFPLSVVFSNLVHFLFSGVILLILLLVFQVIPTFVWLTLPIFLFLQIIFIFGLTLLTSALSVYFRDIPILIESFLPVWYFATPIFYPVSFIPTRFQDIYMLNPMASYVTAYRAILLEDKLPGPGVIAVVFLSSIITLLIGYFVFTKIEKRFAEEI